MDFLLQSSGSVDVCAGVLVTSFQDTGCEDSVQIITVMLQCVACF